MQSSSVFNLIVTAAVAAALASCATEAPPLPATDVPMVWQSPIVTDAPVWPAADWWNSFADPELTALISAVQANNLDLANNQRNLEAAQLALREAGFNLLPTPLVTIGTGASYRDGDSDSSFDGSGSGNGSGTTRDPNANTPFTLGASFSYNDILSKPATYTRAVADYDSRVAQVADVALNTLGTASSTYFQLLLTRDKITAANQNVANAEAIGRIAQARVDAGVAVPIEALQQRIAIERERNNLRGLIQNDLATRASLALLSGRSVQDYNLNGQTLQNLVVPRVQPGLPSDLLQRRPDLVQAEAALRSANANIAIVRTDLFPQIALTGGINTASTSLSEILTSPDTVFTISASLVQTLLDNGQRFRNIDQAQLAMENSLALYRKTVIGAFNDIEVLLSNIQLLEAQGLVAFDNLGAAEESFRIAQARYGEGVEDYETVLVSQNTLFSSRNAWLDNKLLQLNAIIGLYQALGGGWQAPPANSTFP
jgi:NodT family efflux transporter outer membrane factor (OMF) lipoprotein